MDCPDRQGMLSLGERRPYSLFFAEFMLKLSRSGISLWLVAGVLSFSSVACSRANSLNQGTSAPPKSSPVAIASPAAKSVKSPQSEAYQLAIDKAQSAKSMSQSVQSADDWKLVASRWQQAIGLLKQVPKADPNKKFANQKLAEYQRSLALAQSRADQTGRDRGETLESKIVVDAPLTDAMREANASGVGGGGSYRARIKYRQSRIPVIDVLFNGSRQFDMMVDTGASGTMITPDMAQALGAKIVGSTTGMTPAGQTEFAVGMIKSIRVGTRVIRDVPVTIGPVRLLGHDFFGSCDLTIKQETIEFQQCAG